MSRAQRAGSALVAGALAVFTARRLAFMAVAGRRPDRPSAPVPALPTATILVAARDEEHALPGLLEALDGALLPDSPEIIVVDDGSGDGTPALLAAWAAGGSNRRALTLDSSVGKAAALNAALALVNSEIVVVYDADDRPAPDAPARLLAAFSDEHVGAVSGRRRVSNSGAGLWASYAALEADVHQLVTQRAKDRLELGPAVLGSNCAYRRADLVREGGFRPGALLEDSDVTVKLLRAGHSTRFLEDAHAEHAAPTSLRGWWHRRVRWSTGFVDVARDHHGPPSSSGRPLLDAEIAVFSVGYADRLAAVLAAGLWATGRSTRVLRGITSAAVVVAVAETGLALHLASASPRRWRYLAALPAVAAVDVAASMAGMACSVAGRRRWERRARDHIVQQAGAGYHGP